MDKLTVNILFLSVIYFVTIGAEPNVGVNRIPPGEQVIPGRFIVTLDQDDDSVTLTSFASHAQKHNLLTSGSVDIGRKLITFVRGMNISQERLLAMPGVSAVEPDRRVYATLTTALTPSECHTQDVSNIWGLDRIDQQSNAPTLEYQHGVTSSGAGTTVYVVDSGVNVADPDFEGRASYGFTAPDILAEGQNDLNGHGTHVAGTVGGVTYGVAKQTEIVSVKVLDSTGTGSSSGLIEGVDWIRQQHMQKTYPKSVINLSLGFGGISDSVDTAIQAAVDAGVTVVVAAGNEAADACNSSPAHINDVITVGASTSTDRGASFSNMGTCLDIWAPGQYIISVNHTGGEGATLSGTSMASPHVAGAVARYMSSLDIPPTPAETAHWVISSSSKDLLSFSNLQSSSPNRLLHMPCVSEYTTPPMSRSVGGPRPWYGLLTSCVYFIWLFRLVQ